MLMGISQCTYSMTNERLNASFQAYTQRERLQSTTNSKTNENISFTNISAIKHHVSGAQKLSISSGRNNSNAQTFVPQYYANTYVLHRRCDWIIAFYIRCPWCLCLVLKDRDVIAVAGPDSEFQLQSDCAVGGHHFVVLLESQKA